MSDEARSSRRPKLSWLPFGLTLAVVTALLLIPHPRESVPHLDVSDALVHLLAYLLLAVTGGLAARSHLWLLVFLPMHGLLTEYLQGFVPGRQPSAADWLADLGGALVGILIVLVARWARRSRQDSRSATAANGQPPRT